MIFSTHPLHPDIEKGLSGIAELRVASAPSPATIEAESAGSELIVVRAPIPESVVRREMGLRALIRHGAGLDMIPVEAATGCGVIVANVPGANAVTVAEHVIWSSMALLRRQPEVRAGLVEGWETGRTFAPSGRELSGRTLGVVGMGNVGQALATIASQGFGMKVISHTRSPAKLPAGIDAVSLNDLLAQADVVALCCPLTEETRGLIGAAQIAAMRPGAILVNVSRGPVVVEMALMAALSSGHLGGAALDVFETQPLPTDHPLMALPNVILTPHMAGITEESMLRMGQGVLDQARQIMAGDEPTNFINPECLPLYRKRFA